ncbi:hypothetical protein [Stratiformator vulcanicus]|uniref:Uncharacterized protein n=1 Tax=Stratiformator vulcanicus TaxID=2527980 RepID=A0A517R1A8_9PLAN|nr:hypothetical protein [Stratiformator vulcanicus]QDT37685.1 hypothetical protein Pan189_20670 [Stratiformator vulcanicus]
MTYWIKRTRFKSFRERGVKAEVWKNITADGKITFSVSFTPSANPNRPYIAIESDFGMQDLMAIADLTIRAYAETSVAIAREDQAHC